MDRRVVASLVGMMLVGCAQARSAIQGPGRDPSGQPPVGLTPLPAIGDSINSTSGFPGVAPPANFPAPTNPTASGPAAVIPSSPVPTSPVEMTPLPSIREQVGRGLPAGRGPAMFGKARNRGVIPPSRPAPRPLADTPQAGPTAMPATFPDLLATDPPAPIPAPAGRPAPYAGQEPETARAQADPAFRPSGAGRPAPLADDRPRSARPRASADERSPGPRPQAPASNSPAYRPAESPVGPIPGPSPVPIDPSPEMPAPLPAPPSLDPVPLPPAGSTPPPIGQDPLPGPEPSTPIPPPEVPPGPAAPPATGPAPAPPADPEVKRASQDSTALKLKADETKELPFATLRAAAVGDEVITLEELNQAVGQRLEEIGSAGPRDGAERKQFINMIAAQALDHMIDQRVIIQEAKRQMKNPKAQQMFDDFVAKTWREDELPPLLRKTATSNVHELKIKLAEQGKSYDGMKEAFRKKLLARDFLGHMIKDKVTCDLAEQRAYYNEHLADYEQPARISWREIEITVAKYPDRAAAKRKADAVLARLLRAEDFDAVARTVSDGPTASKGGLYADMTPGSYGIPVVNDELNRLPVGQASRVLEAPASFHIVRVESRREAGPLRFDEVQDKIRPQVLERNYVKAVDGYLAKLRARTLIRTMFDNTASDPKLVRRNDASVRPAANR